MKLSLDTVGIWLAVLLSGIAAACSWWRIVRLEQHLKSEGVRSVALGEGPTVEKAEAFLARRAEEKTPDPIADAPTEQLGRVSMLPTPDETARHAADPREVLFPAPTVGGTTLKDWLIYNHKDDNVWAEVIEDFYARAASDPIVAPYFAGHDLDDIKRKFLATFLIVVHTGVSRAAYERLVEKHANLQISPVAYDHTIGALVVSLRAWGVPINTIDQMKPMLDVLRDGLVWTNV